MHCIEQVIEKLHKMLSHEVQTICSGFLERFFSKQHSASMATEEFVDSTIATMKIIGMVPKNGKLCIRKGHLCLDVSDQVQFVRRWAQGDSRDCTLMHVRNTFNSAFKISRFLINLPAGDSYMTFWTLDRMVTEMAQCETGLQNLKTTYSADSMMVANLEVLLDRLTAHEAELTKFLSRKNMGPPTSSCEQTNLFSGAELHQDDEI